MGFPARASGICIRCSKEIIIGQEITWNRIERNKIWHVACEEPANGSLVPGQPLKAAGNGSAASAVQNPPKVIPAPIEPSLKPEPPAKRLAREAVDFADKSNPLTVFLDAIAPMIEKRVAGKVDEDKVLELIKKHAPKSPSLEIRNIDSGAIAKIDSAHEKLPSLLYYISRRHHVYMHGPAGSGKSTAARQVSEALSLPWGYISLNPQTPDSRLLGFIDAGGTYRKTVFYDCYLNGGVFCIDEMDNASASLLTTLNSMLENGHGAFPAGIHPRHKDFVLVATGNTNGRGGNLAHPERRAFDTAFAERFTYLAWDYDKAMEKSAALSINPDSEAYIDWIWALRDHCQKHHPRVIVSPRATFKGALYLLDLGPLKAEDMIEGLIFKGIEGDTVKSILREVGGMDKWAK